MIGIGTRSALQYKAIIGWYYEGTNGIPLLMNPRNTIIIVIIPNPKAYYLGPCLRQNIFSLKGSNFGCGIQLHITLQRR